MSSISTSSALAPVTQPSGLYPYPSRPMPKKKKLLQGFPAARTWIRTQTPDRVVQPSNPPLTEPALSVPSSAQGLKPLAPTISSPSQPLPSLTWSNGFDPNDPFTRLLVSFLMERSKLQADWVTLPDGRHINIEPKYQVGDKIKRNTDGKVFTITRDLGKETERAGGKHTYVLQWKKEDGGNDATLQTSHDYLPMNYRKIKAER